MIRYVRGAVMFTKLKLRNFKSFKNVDINFESQKNIAKKVIAIYGINGSGKTTITQAFSVLNQTMETMQIRRMLNDILDEKLTPPDDFPLKQEIFLKVLKSKYLMNGLENIIKEYKMVDSSENMILEYEFVIEGNTGSYYIEMNDSSIVKERLEFKLDKRRGCYFSLEDDDININGKIFETKDFYNLIHKQVEMYWGKHSLLSILSFEMSDKSDTFINSNISANLMKVMLFFNNINCCTTSLNQNINANYGFILENLRAGHINKSDEKYLNQIEEILDGIFKSIFADVEKVFYKKKTEEDQIHYRLFLRKKIEEKIFNINFNLESAGTKEILELLPSFVAAASGEFVVIDEYGIRIHDVLSAKLLGAISDQITGQLLITTHNTLIMDNSKLAPESLYFIKNDKTLTKQVVCVTDIENRTHPNYNYRTRYLTNENYQDSMPATPDRIDLSKLVNIFKQLKTEYPYD